MKYGHIYYYNMPNRRKIATRYDL